MFKSSQSNNFGGTGGYGKTSGSLGSAQKFNSSLQDTDSSDKNIYKEDFEMKIDYDVKKIFDFKHYKENLLKIYQVFREDIVNLNSNLRQLYYYYEHNFLNMHELSNEVVAQLQRKTEVSIGKITSGVKVPPNELEISDRVVGRLGLDDIRDLIRREIEELQQEIEEFFAEDAYYRRSSYALSDFYLTFEKIFKLYDILDHRGSLHNFMTVNTSNLFNDLMHKEVRDTDVPDYLVLNVPFLKERLSESQYYRTSNPGSKDRTLFRVNEVLKNQPTPLVIESVYSVAKNQIIREKRALIQSLLEVFKRRLPEGLQLPEAMSKSRDELSDEIRGIREEVLSLEGHNRAFNQIITGQLNPEYIERMSLEHDSIDLLLDVEKLFFIVSEMTQKMRNYLNKFDDHKSAEAKHVAESIEQGISVVREELAKKYQGWDLRAVVEELFSQLRETLEKDRDQRNKLSDQRQRIQEERKNLYDHVNSENDKRAREFEEKRKQQYDTSGLRSDLERKYDLGGRGAEANVRPPSREQRTEQAASSVSKDTNRNKAYQDSYSNNVQKEIKKLDDELQSSASKSRSNITSNHSRNEIDTYETQKKVDPFKREEPKKVTNIPKEEPVIKKEEPKPVPVKKEEPKPIPVKKEEPKVDFFKKEEPKLQPIKKEEPIPVPIRKEEPKIEPPKVEPKKEEKITLPTKTDIFKRTTETKPEGIDEVLDLLDDDTSLRGSAVSGLGASAVQKKDEEPPKNQDFWTKKETSSTPFTIKKEEKPSPLIKQETPPTSSNDIWGKPAEKKGLAPLPGIKKDEPKTFTLPERKKDDSNGFYDDLEEDSDEELYIPGIGDKNKKKELPAISGAKKPEEPKKLDPIVPDVKKKDFLFGKREEEPVQPQKESEDEYDDEQFEVDSPPPQTDNKQKLQEQQAQDVDEFDVLEEDIPESNSQEASPRNSSKVEAVVPPQTQQQQQQQQQQQKEEIPQKEYPALFTTKSVNSVNSLLQKLEGTIDMTVTPEQLNTLDVLIVLFQDYFSQFKLFIFDFAEADTILEQIGQTPKTFKASSVSKAKQEEIAQYLVKYYQEIIPNQPTVNVNSRFFIPFFADDEVLPSLIELDVERGNINYIYTGKVPAGVDNFLKELQILIKNIFNYVFQGEDSKKFKDIVGYKAIGTDDKTAVTLNKFGDGLYLKLMSYLFYIVYETSKDVRKEPISFDDGFTNRLFYTLNSLLFIRDMSANPAWEQYIEFFTRGIQELSDEQQMFISISQLEENGEDPAALDRELESGVQELVNKAKNGCKEIFFAFDIIQNQFKTVYFIYINNKSKIGKKPFHLIMLSINDSQVDERVEQICKRVAEKQNFEVKPYRETPRHNYLYEYVDLTLGAWVTAISNFQIEAMDAISCLFYNLAGFHVEVSAEDEGDDQGFEHGMMGQQQGQGHGQGDDDEDYQFDDEDLPIDEIDDDNF